MMRHVVVDNVSKLLFCQLKSRYGEIGARPKNAKKHVRPASSSADMLPKTDDRSDMYYDNRCRQNPCVSFLSHKIIFIITKNTNSSRNKFGVRLGRVRFTQRAEKDRIELVGARAKPLPTAVEFRWFYRAGEIIAPLDRRSRRLRWSCTPRRRWWSADRHSTGQRLHPCPARASRRGRPRRGCAPD